MMELQEYFFSAQFLLVDVAANGSVAMVWCGSSWRYGMVQAVATVVVAGGMFFSGNVMFVR
ncbi:Hypothetical predicted protein [Olea europaea subsp. europaea]|uniref:Uncharacterized protein n=1 Tax=Olea europaea subsp. europaea TaxID=158383 RepID=A0A8S0VAV8_OLEEU|nr:Hypothetical predicted protein [Olea europaea subsp. europaea]